MEITYPNCSNSRKIYTINGVLSQKFSSRIGLLRYSTKIVVIYIGFTFLEAHQSAIAVHYRRILHIYHTEKLLLAFKNVVLFKVTHIFLFLIIGILIIPSYNVMNFKVILIRNY